MVRWSTGSIRLDGRRRVQAAPGTARRQDHAEGVRQGPPDAGHQPDTGAEPVAGGSSIETRDARLGPIRRRCSTCCYGSRCTAALRSALDRADWACRDPAEDTRRSPYAPLRAGRLLGTASSATARCTGATALGRSARSRSCRGSRGIGHRARAHDASSSGSPRPRARGVVASTRASTRYRLLRAARLRCRGRTCSSAG